MDLLIQLPVLSEFTTWLLLHSSYVINELLSTRKNLFFLSFWCYLTISINQRNSRKNLNVQFWPGYQIDVKKTPNKKGLVQLADVSIGRKDKKSSDWLKTALNYITRQSLSCSVSFLNYTIQRSILILVSLYAVYYVTSANCYIGQFGCHLLFGWWWLLSNMDLEGVRRLALQRWLKSGSSRSDLQNL